MLMWEFHSCHVLFGDSHWTGHQSSNTDRKCSFYFWFWCVIWETVHAPAAFISCHHTYWFVSSSRNSIWSGWSTTQPLTIRSCDWLKDVSIWGAKKTFPLPQHIITVYAHYYFCLYFPDLVCHLYQMNNKIMKVHFRKTTFCNLKQFWLIYFSVAITAIANHQNTIIIIII